MTHQPLCESSVSPPNTTCPLLYLVGGCVQVGQGDVQQVVLQGVDARGDGQLQCFYGFVENFLTQDAVQSSHAVTWGVKKQRGLATGNRFTALSDNFVDNVTPDLRCFQVLQIIQLTWFFTSGTRTMLNMSLCLSEKPEKPDSVRGSKYAIWAISTQGKY